MRITQRGRTAAAAAFFMLAATSIHSTVTSSPEQPARTCYASTQECADMTATISSLDN